MKIFNKISVAVLTIAFTLAIAGSSVVLAAGPASVDLGSAGDFVILAKTGISTTGATKVTGDIAVSPAAATFITGFALILPAASPFSTSALVTGKVYAPGYANPTPAKVTTAISDMQTAYTSAAGRTNPTATELGAGNIGGMTLAPGLYKWGTGVTIPTDVTLSGGANDVWIFQIAQTLTVSSATKIILSGGAQASNIFWVVGGQTTIGTTAVFNGNILDQTAIVLKTGATLNGRALAQSAVTLDANSVTIPTASNNNSSSANNPSTTATVAQSTTPVTFTITPPTATTPAVTETTMSPGCSGGNKYNTSNGQLCVNSTIPSVDTGCLLGNKFSVTTGRNCMSSTPNANAIANANANANFNRDLTLGKTGEDVKSLQVWLNAHGYAVALSGSGSSGNETTTFGELTRSALAKFQAKVGISPALGNFGPITRGYLKANY